MATLIGIALITCAFTWLTLAAVNAKYGKSAVAAGAGFVVIGVIALIVVGAATDDFDSPLSIYGAMLMAFLIGVPAIITAIASAIFMKSPEDR